MRTSENTFKRALGEQTSHIGLWLRLADPCAVEMCATAGFDWLLIDDEHAPNDQRSILSAPEAVAAYPAHPVVRISHSDAALIKQMLEIGVATLLVPVVESAEQVRELIRAMRYPPAGVCGVASSLARSSRWISYSDYLQQANDQVSLLVQVETISAVGQLDAIAAIEGIDGVFCSSFLQTFRRPRDSFASEGTQRFVEDAMARILAAGRALGVFATDETTARRYLEISNRFLAVEVDATLLASATRALAKHCKAPGNTEAAAAFDY